MDFILKKLDEKNFADYYEVLNLMSGWQAGKPLESGVKERLYEDAFGVKRRYEGLLAFEDQKCVGISSFFELYSTFAGRPVFWIDDIFVLEEYRGKGVGKKVFLECIKMAKERNCDRAEWHAFGDGPKKFYENFGARNMTEHSHYRLDSNQFNNILNNE
ncbi:MAG: GNAT family N-acetyltransferase [Patescibacteria group bacterium]